MKSKHAIMFRFSNNAVQVRFFQDKSEIRLSSYNKFVTYVNYRGEKTTYPLSSAMDSDNEKMKRRLEYT